MNNIINPFIVKGRIPSAYFCDRVAETEKLTREVLSGNNIVIMSSRRLGKTGLIQHCYDQPAISDNYHTFFVDILETTSFLLAVLVTYAIEKPAARLLDKLRTRRTAKPPEQVPDKEKPQQL